MFTAILGILTTGAGGGIVGGLLALFRTSGERKERLALAQLELDRDRMDAAEAAKEHDRAKEMIALNASVQLQKVETETDAEIEIEGMKALDSAQIAEFANLNTSTWVDNWRAIIRPALCTALSFIFFGMLIWAFAKYNDEITATEGKEILAGLFLTLEFGVNAAWSFYYVARRNSRP